MGSVNNEDQLYHEHEEETENGGLASCRDRGRQCRGQERYETLWERVSQGGPKPRPAHTASVVPHCLHPPRVSASEDMPLF